MSKLPLPVGDSLRDGFDEVDVQRVWRGIQERSAAQAGRSRVQRWGVLAAVLAAAAVLIMVLLPQRSAVPAGALELAGGGVPSLLEASSSEPERAVELADGSRIVLTSGAALDVLSNEAGSFLTVLRRGRSHFDVRPSAHRRWVIECGLATVEVVGTAFSIEREPGRVEVAVERGTVIVRGERVPDRVQRLTMGERLVISATSAAAPAAPAPSTSAADAPAACTSASASAATVEPPRRTPSQAGSARVESRRADLDDLVRRADAARRAGDLAQASELYDRVVREADKGDPRAAIAALTLARINMASSPDRASRALASALEGAPQGLEEDVLARLVEARARAGDREGARRAAELYEKNFPNGARLSEVRRWVFE